jgi:disulfide bond formation protein DsbB
MIGLGIAIVAAKSTPAPRWLSIGLLAAALAVALWSAYLGGYHAGVEYKWWAGPASCTGGALPSDISLDNLSASEVVKCDVVPWEVFHISLAGFNFLFSLLAIGLAAFGLRGR